MHPEEIAWCAGLFEGEGTIFSSMVNKPKQGYLMRRLTMAIDMTDEDVIKKFHKIVGGQQYGPYRAYGAPTIKIRKNRYRWVITNIDEIEKLTTLFWPWLGERRREQVNKALTSYYKSRSERIDCNSGTLD